LTIRFRPPRNREYAFSQINVNVAIIVPAKSSKNADVKFLCYRTRTQKKLHFPKKNKQKISRLIVDLIDSMADTYLTCRHLFL